MKRIMWAKLILISLSLFFVSCGTDSSRINEPRVGDVYQIERQSKNGKQYAYQLLKIISIKGDKLILAPNKVFYSEKVYCLTSGDYFSLDLAYESNTQKLRKLYDEGKVIDVFRYYEHECLGIER